MNEGRILDEWEKFIQEVYEKLDHAEQQIQRGNVFPAWEAWNLLCEKWFVKEECQ